MQDAIYRATVPVFTKLLGNLDAMLDKALAFAEAKKIDPAVLLGMRLAPDMFPLLRQVRIACDFAKGTSARLAGVEVPKYEDNEVTVADLKARIARTREYLGTLSAAQFADAATRTVTVKAGDRELTFVGDKYLFEFGLPNFYFHLTTAYAILRHAGVDLGKRDFIGAV